MYRVSGTHDKGKFAPSYIPEFTTPEEFIKEKIEMLMDSMRIDLTEEDIRHLYEFKTENEINAAVKGILNKYWK